jgi:hypothetical protein
MGLSVIAKDIQRVRTQEMALRSAYDLVSSRFEASRWKTFGQFWKFFRTDLEKLWKKKGFIHCTHMNRILKRLLVESGQFKESDITFKWTVLSFVSPHQYVEVKMKSGKKIAVDVWGKAYGIPFGEYARGLNATLFPVKND